MSKLSCDFIFSRFLNVGEFVALGFFVTVVFSILYSNFIQRSKVGDTGLIIFLVGTSGNLLERLRFGCVRDYINFFGYFHFNIWDLMVSLGIILIGWGIWKKK
jgi:lipoprotein signal peptidase